MSAPVNEIRTRATWKPAAALLWAAVGMLSTAPGNAQTANAPVLEVPAHSVPVPSTVSPQMAKIIGLPLRTNWNVLPKTGEEWKPVADAGAKEHRDLRQFGGRGFDARNDLERQAGRAAAARRDRTGHADVRRNKNRGHLRH